MSFGGEDDSSFLAIEGGIITAPQKGGAYIESIK